MHTTWFSTLIQHWTPPGRQGDPVEFLSFMLQGLQFDGLDMSWEQRLQIGLETRCHDKNSRFQPLVLQFDDNLVQHDRLHLRDMMNAWVNNLGMQTAMLADTPLICLHLDRYCPRGDGSPEKCDTPVGLHGGLEIPFFVGAGMEILWRDFQVISAISHQGADEAGHCRSILKTWPDSTDPAHPCMFLLTDDDRIPSRTWIEPKWFTQNVSCVWVCDCTWLDLLRMPSIRATAADAPHSTWADDLDSGALMRMLAE